MMQTAWHAGSQPRAPRYGAILAAIMDTANINILRYPRYPAQNLAGIIIIALFAIFLFRAPETKADTLDPVSGSVKNTQSPLQAMPLQQPPDREKVPKKMESVGTDTKKNNLGSISGKVTLMGRNGEKLSAENIMISLEPVKKEKIQLSPASEHHITTKDKRYLPDAIIIKAGDTVHFENRDNIKHNVFSSSGENAFDLGTYGFKGLKKTSLLHPGVVKVYCNIHPEMATFILVTASSHSYLTKKDGFFEMKAVPAGAYILNVWHVRGQLNQNVFIRANDETKVEMVLDTASFEPVPHKNKYGKDYKVKPAIFSDEVY